MNRIPFCTVILAMAIFSIPSPPAFTQQLDSTEIIGGQGGSSFSDSKLLPEARVQEVLIRSGELVDSVQMVYVIPSTGRTVTGQQHGGSGGRLNTWRLDSDEYIIGLSGRYGNYLDSVRIHTNKRTSPLFGGSGGNREYRIEVPAGNQAVGFTGRAGKYLDAIGLLFTPILYTQISETTISGGRGGSPFSDREIPLGSRISQIRVRAGNNIDSIQAIYVLPNGRMLEGVRHGGEGGNSQTFHLDAGEYIIGLSGRYGNYIDSLRLHTNKRTSPLFGGRGGNRDFRIDIPAGYEAIGFTGRAGDYLDAIGLTYVRPEALPRRTPWRR